MHSELFAGLMRDLDLDAGYGALWDDAPAAAFASVNTMSLFGLHRRWRGAALGHLAARGDDVVRAEPPVLRGPAPARASTSGRRCSTTSTWRPTPSTSRSPRSTCAARWSPRSPELLPDVLFGAACSLAMDGVAAAPPARRVGGRPLGAAAGPAPRRLTAHASGSARLPQDLRRRARPARRARRGEPRPLVRAVAEGLDAGLPAPAERDGVAAGVDLGAVLVDAAGSRRGRSAARPGRA